MKKKIISLALVICLLAIAIVGGTMAYFTDTHEETNTFTMGKVGIDLSEPNYTPGADDKLKVFPGQSYPKDPTITVDADSEDCYLVATVTISNMIDLKNLYADDTTGVKQPWGLSLAGAGKMVSGGLADYTAAAAVENGISGTMLSYIGTDVAFLTYSEDATANTIIYTFYFKNIHSAGDKEVLFTHVNIPGIIDNGDISSDLTVKVNAYAIQAVGFDDVYAAYAAYTAQEG